MTKLDKLLALSDQRDEVVSDLTEDMVALLTPTVGAAVKIILDVSAVEANMCDILIYEDIMVVIFDLKVPTNFQLSDTSTTPHILADIDLDEDSATEDGFYFTNMSITFPTEMAFAPPAELVEFLRKFPIRSSGTVVDDDDEEDIPEHDEEFDELKLTEQQKRSLAILQSSYKKGTLQ